MDWKGDKLIEKVWKLFKNLTKTKKRIKDWLSSVEVLQLFYLHIQHSASV